MKPADLASFYHTCSPICHPSACVTLAEFPSLDRTGAHASSKSSPAAISRQFASQFLPMYRFHYNYLQPPHSGTVVSLPLHSYTACAWVITQPKEGSSSHQGAVWSRMEQSTACIPWRSNLGAPCIINIHSSLHLSASGNNTKLAHSVMKAI